jgi:Domain of unknown function (DUF427)
MRAIWKDTILAESDNTVVVEENHYFPQKSVAREHLAPSDTHAVCPWKGTASYYLGPSPIPPWVVSRKVNFSLRSELAELFLHMNKGRDAPYSRKVDCSGSLKGHDRDYDPIRHTARVAESIKL